MTLASAHWRQPIPQGFVEGRPGLFVIDEIQRAPELLLAIKSSVDRQPRPGRFLITGSSQLSANRAVSETLAGRIERHTLWPLSQGEILRRPETFLSQLLEGDLPTGWISELDKRSYLERALAGGYPEASTREGRRRRAWFSAYIQTVIEREAPGVSASPRTADLPRLPAVPTGPSSKASCSPSCYARPARHRIRRNLLITVTGTLQRSTLSSKALTAGSRR